MSEDIMNMAEYNEGVYPVLMDENIDLKRYRRIPIGEIASLGVGFNSISTAIQNYTTLAANPETGAVSGIYKVVVEPSQHLTFSAEKGGYIGMSRNAENVVKSQATMNPIHFDPTTVFMAVAMMSIQLKLNDIQETQQEILQFLEEKEKAELRGNILVLSDIIDNYKYNWNNQQYLSNNHVKVLDIKQKSEQSILFAQSRISDIVDRKQLIHLSMGVDSKTKKLNTAFEDYQLAMYTYAMASYVEAMLLKNFDRDYMYNVADKIDEYSIRYRELYTECYNALAQLEDSSVDTILLGGIGKASRAAGKAIAKVPVVEKAEFDEVLVGVGNILDDQTGTIKSNKLASLVSKQSSYVTPYVDSIKTLGDIHEKPLNILFDSENLYVERISA